MGSHRRSRSGELDRRVRSGDNSHVTGRRDVRGAAPPSSPRDITMPNGRRSARSERAEYPKRQRSLRVAEAFRVGIISSPDRARDMQRASAVARARNRQRRFAAVELARSEHLLVELEELTAAQREVVQALIGLRDSGQRGGARTPTPSAPSSSARRPRLRPRCSPGSVLEGRAHPRGHRSHTSTWEPPGAG